MPDERLAEAERDELDARALAALDWDERCWWAKQMLRLLAELRAAEAALSDALGGYMCGAVNAMNCPCRFCARLRAAMGPEQNEMQRRAWAAIGREYPPTASVAVEEEKHDA